MAADRLDAEIDANYDAFQRQLGRLLAQHRGEYALMRSGEVVEFFVKPGDAFRAGKTRFEDQIFSIQEVIDEPIDLGFFSHVAH